TKGLHTWEEIPNAEEETLWKEFRSGEATQKATAAGLRTQIASAQARSKKLQGELAAIREDRHPDAGSRRLEVANELAGLNAWLSDAESSVPFAHLDDG